MEDLLILEGALPVDVPFRMDVFSYGTWVRKRASVPLS